MQENSTTALSRTPSSTMTSGREPLEQFKVPPDLRLIFLYDKESFGRVLPAPFKSINKSRDHLRADDAR